MTVTDYPDFAVSQDRANKIAATGAPPLNKATVLGGATISAMAIGSSQSVGPFTTNQISYELYLSVAAAVGVAAMTAITAVIDWKDSTTGLILAERSYEILAGTSGTPHVLKISGPARADSITITFTNEAHSAGTVTIIWDLLAVSRQYLRDVPRDNVTAGVGFSPGNPNVPYGILGNLSPTLGAGAAASRVLGMYGGRAILTAFTAGANATLQVEIQEPQQGDQILANTPDVWRGLTDSHGNLQATIGMPNLHCLIVLTNLDTVSRVCTATLVIDESGE